MKKMALVANGHETDRARALEDGLALEDDVKGHPAKIFQTQEFHRKVSRATP